MSKKNESHGNPQLHFFEKILSIGHFPLIKAIRILISLIFIEIAPEIPVNLKKAFAGSSGKKALIIGASLAFFFCFIVNVIMSKFNGTLMGEDDQIMYFLEDKWNLILYTIVCPVYVGFTCRLGVIVIKSWGEINDFKNTEILPQPKIRKYDLLRTVVLIFLILSVAYLLTTNYINDIMRLVDKEIYYWFIDENLQLGPHGIYYFLLNFSLLIVTLIAFVFFMSIFKLVMDIGKGLAKKNEIENLEFKILKTKLSAFTEAYLVTKWIVAAYIVNIWVWALSPLGKGVTDNFEIAVILLALIGLVFLSFPRLYVELQWHKLKARSSHSLDMRHQDLRDNRIKYIVYVLDTFFMSSFTLGAINYLYDFSHLLQ